MAIFKIGKTIISSLFKKPATAMYPVIPRQWEENTRGQIVMEMADCILCGICMRKCPSHAITMDKTAKAWTIERMRCIQCNCCVELCPKKCLKNDNQYTTPDTVKLIDTFEKPLDVEGAEDKIINLNDDAKLKCSDTCIYCGLCVKKCPEEALTVTRAKKNKETGEQEGQNSWQVDHNSCIKCGLCIEACPKHSLTIE